MKSSAISICKAAGQPWILALALLLNAVRPTVAQEVKRYEVALQGVSLEDALHELLIRTELELAYEQRLVTGRYTYCAIQNALAEDVLRCVLEDTGLDFFRLSSGLYVLVERAATTPRYGALQGTIVDAETGEPLSQAHIFLSEDHGTVASDEGRFLFPNLEPGYYAVTSSYVGYRHRVDVIRVPPDSVAHANLELQPDGISAVPIVVDGLQWHPPSGTPGSDEVTATTLQGGGSIPNVNRVLGSMVGIRLNDATADLHIQSSGSGEHLYRLDGAPVYVPAAIAGLIGPFSPYGLGRITVHKTGFGADLGSQLSGVIDATHALFRQPAHKLDVQLDPISLNARLGFGIRRSTSLMVATRTGLWEKLTPGSVRSMLTHWNTIDHFMFSAFRAVPYSADSEGHYFRNTEFSVRPGVRFGDVHLAFRHRFGALRSIHASAYWGRRQLDSPGGTGQSPSESAAGSDLLFATSGLQTVDNHIWTNLTTQVKYEAVVSGRLMASLRGRISHYAMRHDISVTEPVQNTVANKTSLSTQIDLRDDSGNKVQEVGLEARSTYLPLRSWRIEAGLEPVHTRSRFLVHGIREAPIAHVHAGNRITGFLSSHLSFAGKLNVDGGLRATTILKDGTTYLEPRLALRYDASGRIPWSARLSSGIYRQFVNQFDVSSRSARALTSRTRMWLGHDASVRPPQAVHWSAEILISPRTSWTVRVETYYKQLRHLLSVDYSAQTYHSEAAATTSEQFLSAKGSFPSVQQQHFLASGRGFAHGLALVAEKKLIRGRVSTSYEYSVSQRSFGPMFNGDRLNAPWLEPHRVEFMADYSLTSQLTLRTRMYGIWGRTWAFQQSYYDFFGAYGKRLIGDLSELGNTADVEYDLLDRKTVVQNMLYHQLQNPDYYTLSPLMQLDFSAAFTQSVRVSVVQARVDLINVLSALNTNVADWYLVQNQDAADPLIWEPAKRRLMPFTPLVALRVSW